MAGFGLGGMNFNNIIGVMKGMGNMVNQFEQLQNMVSLIRNGGNPAALLGQFVQNNPQAQQLMQNLNGKSPEELRTYAENMAKSYGTDLDTVMQRLGYQK